MDVLDYAFEGQQREDEYPLLLDEEAEEFRVPSTPTSLDMLIPYPVRHHNRRYVNSFGEK